MPETKTNLSARPKWQSIRLMEILRDGVVIATVENERLKSVLASMQNPESNQEPT